MDVSENKVLRVGGLWYMFNEKIRSESYQSLIDEQLVTYVHQDDRAYYLDLMNRENFISSLDNGIDKLGCQIRRLVDGNMLWMQLNIHLFSNPYSQHVEALICLENIDNSKRLSIDNKNETTNKEQKKRRQLQTVGPPVSPLFMDEEGDAFEHFVNEQGAIAYLVDMDTFELVTANSALYMRTGMTKSQCEGKACYEIMQGRKTPCPFCSSANWSRDHFYLWRNWNEKMEKEFLIENKIVHFLGGICF